MALLVLPFQNWRSYVGHSGIDFGQPSRTPIPASADGEVLYAGYWNERAGYGVLVAYDSVPGIRWLYCHQDNTRGMPRVGSRIRRGSQLGLVGELGKYSTGPHLHLEGFDANDNGVDEWKYFSKTRYVGMPVPARTESELMANLTKEEIDAIATATARKVWEFEVSGGAPLPDGTQIPKESAARRLQQIRRVTTASARGVADLLTLDSRGSL